MKPIDRINLLLVAALLALVALQHWPFGARPYLLGLRAEQVQSIQVRKQGRLALTLQRDATGWKMTYPRMASADGQRVQLLLGLLQLPSPGAAIRVAPNLVGLQPPQLQLRFNTTELNFGTSSMAGKDRYIGVHGKVYLVKDLAYQVASLPADQYLAHH